MALTGLVPDFWRLVAGISDAGKAWMRLPLEEGRKEFPWGLMMKLNQGRARFTSLFLISTLLMFPSIGVELFMRSRSFKRLETEPNKISIPNVASLLTNSRSILRRAV